MAYQYDVNRAPTTGAEAIFDIAFRLVTSTGWTYHAWSNGTTRVVGGAGISAAGLANTSAYVEVKQGPRSLGFQRGADNRTWYIVYTADGFASDGAAAVMDTAADRRDVWGIGAAALLFGMDNDYRWSIVADDAAGSRHFVAMAWQKATGTPQAIICLDKLQAVQAGDVDGFVVYVDGNAAVSTYDRISSTQPGKAWLRKTGAGVPAGADFVAMYAAVPYIAGNAILADGTTLGADPHTAKDHSVPLLWARPVGQPAPQGFKGWSTIIRGRAAQRATGDTQNVSVVQDRVYFSHLVLPWLSGTAPIV